MRFLRYTRSLPAYLSDSLILRLLRQSRPGYWVAFGDSQIDFGNGIIHHVTLSVCSYETIPSQPNRVHAAMVDSDHVRGRLRGLLRAN